MHPLARTVTCANASCRWPSSSPLRSGVDWTSHRTLHGACARWISIRPDSIRGSFAVLASAGPSQSGSRPRLARDRFGPSGLWELFSRSGTKALVWSDIYRDRVNAIGEPTLARHLMTCDGPRRVGSPAKLLATKQESGAGCPAGPQRPRRDQGLPGRGSGCGVVDTGYDARVHIEAHSWFGTTGAARTQNRLCVKFDQHGLPQLVKELVLVS